jgi:GT2 family glycosyltransferase
LSENLSDHQVEAVVVSWNSGLHLRECVESLALSLPLEHIHVVDNASIDGSVRGLPCGVDILQLPTNEGFGCAVNRALRLLTRELLLVLNPDARVGPDALQALENCFSDEAVAAVQPLLTLPDGRVDSAGSFLTWSGFLVHCGYDAPANLISSPEVEEIFAAKGAALMMRADVVRAVGGFDPSFFLYFEDSDLSWRLRLAGYRVLLSRAATVVHDRGHAAARWDSAEIEYHSFRNRLSSLIKNLSLPRMLVILPIHVAICLGIALAYLTRGRFRHAYAIVRALAWNARNFRSVLAGRAIVQACRTKPDSSVFQLSYSRGIYLGPGVAFARAYFRARDAAGAEVGIPP